MTKIKFCDIDLEKDIWKLISKAIDSVGVVTVFHLCGAVQPKSPQIKALG